MSEFLEEFSNIIQENGGTIDKYIGDCIMAFFNAPEPVEDHPGRGILSAQQCMRRLQDLQTEWRERGLPELDCRIGLHSGQALCGNFGSKSRFNFTVIGDTVNLASRLESLCKHFEVQTLLSEMCVLATGENPAVVLRFLGKVQVVGKALPTGVYSIINIPNAPVEVRLHLKDLFESAIRNYQSKKFGTCIEELQAYQSVHMQYCAVADKPCVMYIGICHNLLSNGIPLAWSDVLVMDEK
eukprot:ANDGO_01718.mRNA.1 Adenylate cyclase 1